jgi:hypothetical protein
LAGEVVGGDAAVFGFGLGLGGGLRLLGVGVPELVLENALLLLALGGRLLGGLLGEAVAEVAERDLGELVPQSARVEELDQVAERDLLGALQTFEGLEGAEALELIPTVFGGEDVAGWHDRIRDPWRAGAHASIAPPIARNLAG